MLYEVIADPMPKYNYSNTTDVETTWLQKHSKLRIKIRQVFKTRMSSQKQVSSPPTLLLPTHGDLAMSILFSSGSCSNNFQQRAGFLINCTESLLGL